MEYAKLTGDWPRFRYLIHNMTPGLKRAIRSAARKNALLIIREIKRGIRDQAPGGSPFVPLHELTIEEKISKRGIGSATSNRALMRHGDLIRALTYEVDVDGSFQVGFRKGAVNSSGADINMVATVMERGITIAVTDKIRSYFAAQGRPLRASTTHLDVPARPFLEPVLRKHRQEILNNYAMAIDNFLAGRPQVGELSVEVGDSIE